MDLELTDTHTHLGDPVFDNDREAVLARAKAAGIGTIHVVGETLEDARRNLKLARLFPELRIAAGLYPTVLDNQQADQTIELIRQSANELVAIGEVGLDRWKVKDPGELELQQDIFLRFVELAKEVSLPLNIHSRSAGRHVVALLLEHDAPPSQLHAFDGKASYALPALEAGHFFSVPPSIVRSQQKQKLIRRLPLECLLLETDSPVLGPDRETRNEPCNAAISLEAIAELKALPLEEVREALIENTAKLYPAKV